MTIVGRVCDCIDSASHENLTRFSQILGSEKLDGDVHFCVDGVVVKIPLVEPRESNEAIQHTVSVEAIEGEIFCGGSSRVACVAVCVVWGENGRR